MKWKIQVTMCVVAGFFIVSFLYGCMKKATVEVVKPGYQLHPRDKWYCAAVNGKGNIWVGGDGGRIVHSGDNGKIWEMQNSSTPNTIYGISMWSTGDAKTATGVAVGRFGTIVTTDNGGQTWTPQKSGTESTLYDCSFVSNTSGWAVGEMGTVLHTEDGGKTWVAQSSGEDLHFNGVFFLDPLHGWVAAEYGSLFRTEDGGQNWEKNQVSELSFYDIYFNDVSNGWLVGEDGQVFHSIDGGKTWTAQKSGVEGSHLISTVFRGNDGWAVGLNGTLITTKNGGETWEREQLPVPHFVWLGKVVTAPGSEDGMVIVGNAGIVLEHGASGWANAFTAS
ncbi:MAG: YCF48-related protein [Pseudomonadota bacterium]